MEMKKTDCAISTKLVGISTFQDVGKKLYVNAFSSVKLVALTKFFLQCLNMEI